jgi:hypothetical protein
MRDIARQALAVAALSAGAIVLRELGHRAILFLTGTPARVGFQRADPMVPVSRPLWLWGKAGGPVLTLVLALVLLIIARRRGSFSWATAAFTSASLRLFPLTMDLSRAFRGAPPFSDVGELVAAPHPFRREEGQRAARGVARLRCAVISRGTHLALRAPPLARRGRNLPRQPHVGDRRGGRRRAARDPRPLIRQGCPIPG